MRLLRIVVLGVLAVEVLLALAFWAGWTWIGGWPGGLALFALVLVLMVLPWLGDLAVDIDSEAARADVKLGWIGRVTRLGEPTHKTKFRFLFFRWTRPKGTLWEQVKKKPKQVKPSRRPPVATILDSASPILQMVTAGGRALVNLAMEAHELSLEVQSPTPLDRANTVLAGIIGTRKIGPLRLQVSGNGERAIRFRYRIKLVRAAAIGLNALVQARPDRGIRAIHRIRESLKPAKEVD